MKLNNKIKKAVIRGINEAFDIEDMGNDIKQTPAQKQAVDKMSKMTKRLKHILDTYPTDKPRAFNKQISKDDRQFIYDLKEDFDNIDDSELLDMMNDNDVLKMADDLFMLEHIKGVIADIFDNIDYDRAYSPRRFLDPFTIQFIKDYLNHVDSVNHPLYACLKADKQMLKDIIEKSRGICIMNYNWIDVSGIEVFDRIFDSINFDADISLWKFDSATSVSGMFWNVNLQSDISKWRFPKVREMNNMFQNVTFDGDISGWEFPEVEEMNWMFSRSKMKIDISSWNFPKVKTMRGMFCSSDFNGDISGWDVSNVEDLSYMFMCSDFNGDISGWDVSSAKTLDYMFNDSAFKGDISGWDVSNAESMCCMFADTEMYFADLSGWQVSPECHVMSMFARTGIPAHAVPASMTPEMRKIAGVVKDTAVIESFDIEDFGNDISSEVVTKKKVEKHSKMYADLVRLANRKIFHLQPRNLMTRETTKSSRLNAMISRLSSSRKAMRLVTRDYST